MSKIILELEIEQPINLSIEIEQPINLSIEVQNPLFIIPSEVTAKGEKGDKGDGESSDDLLLTVETIGQTHFNIFGNSTTHRLLIDGVEQHEYNIQQIGQNWKLTWTGNVQLAPSDRIIFRKIIKT